MPNHGHAKADARDLALHRLAFEKLRADPDGGRQAALALLERWLAMPHLAASRPLLQRWQRLLELPVEQVETQIMSEQGQQLRQCSPLGVLITTAERATVYQRLTRP